MLWQFKTCRRSDEPNAYLISNSSAAPFAVGCSCRVPWRMGSSSSNVLPFSPHASLRSSRVHPVKVSYPQIHKSIPRLPSMLNQRFNWPISVIGNHLFEGPTSVCENPSPILPPTRKFEDGLCQIAANLLLGSLLLMGSLRVGPAIALPAQGSAAVEEKPQTDSGISENEEMLEKLLKDEPNNVEALKTIVNGKMRKGKTKEAVGFVERLIDIEPNEVEWRLLEALCYEIMGELSKAEKLFIEIVKKRPFLLRALHGLAMVKHKKGEDGVIFEILDKTLNLARREKRVTEERNIRILTAQMHIVKGNLDEATKLLQDLITEDPRDFRPYLCQGIVYSLEDKKKEAGEQFKIYMSLVPEEFPQREFLDDVVKSAKAQTSAQLAREMKAEYSRKK